MCRSWQLAFFAASFIFASANHNARDAVDASLVRAASASENAQRRLHWSERHAQSVTNPFKRAFEKVDNAIFSRPPYSTQETSSVVYGTVAAFGLLCAIVLLVSAHLDWRRARAIVPEESVPCAIAEQYYLDEYLVTLRSSQDFETRKKRMGFCSYLRHYGKGFPDALARQHLCLSLLVKAIPTFTRLKRGILIVVQLHLCILMASFGYSILEHDKPNGKYEMLSCSGSLWSSDCTATLPVSLLVATAAHPVFRFLAVRQMRLTCFFSQSHSSSSPFPLNVRKFARIPAKSAWESFFCMRNSYKRRQDTVKKQRERKRRAVLKLATRKVQVLQSRSLWHRVVHMLWKTTQPSRYNDLRLYGLFTSWCILFVMFAFVAFTIVYVIFYTAYLEDDVVYHWLAFTLTTFFSTIFVLEPLQILFVEVFWCALVAKISQRRGFGAHSLAWTMRYKDVVRQIEETFIKSLRMVAAVRVQRWWSAVLERKASGSNGNYAVLEKWYHAINEQQSTAMNFQELAPMDPLQFPPRPPSSIPDPRTNTGATSNEISSIEEKDVRGIPEMVGGNTVQFVAPRPRDALDGVYSGLKAKKTIHSKKYAKEHKWCLKVEVQECYDLEQVSLDDLMSPVIRLQCDAGNPNVIETKVAWDAHKRAAFNETFFVDIKESQSLYVSAWSKTASSDEFIGRGYFEFGPLKSGDREKPEGQDLKVSLHAIQHGEARSRMKHVRGYVNLRVKFLDPAKEICGETDDTDWMLPKHRMQFALSKMGGRMKVSKMLGGLGAPLSTPVTVTVPSGPLRLDSTWQIGGPRMGSNSTTSLDTPTGSNARPDHSPQPAGNKMALPRNTPCEVPPTVSLTPTMPQNPGMQAPAAQESLPGMPESG